MKGYAAAPHTKWLYLWGSNLLLQLCGLAGTIHFTLLNNINRLGSSHGIKFLAKIDVCGGSDLEHPRPRSNQECPLNLARVCFRVRQRGGSWHSPIICNGEGQEHSWFFGPFVWLSRPFGDKISRVRILNSFPPPYNSAFNMESYFYEGSVFQNMRRKISKPL